MATTELTMDNFEDAITENEIVFVDFWAGWCGPCRQFAPVYERAADAHPDILFGKVDTEAQPDLAAAAEISAIPTLMVIKRGVMILNQAGALPGPALEQVIAAARALDVDAARGAGPDAAQAS
jgi:thioredoxin